MTPKQLEHFRQGIDFQLSSVKTITELSKRVCKVIDAYTEPVNGSTYAIIEIVIQEALKRAKELP